MSAIKFTVDHEWLLIEGSSATVGISDYAQEQLGDVVYVELPEIGQRFSRGDNVGVVESVKAVGEIYMPISGAIEVINDRLVDEPELVNSEPTTGGWLFKITLDDQSDVSGLMDEPAYLEFIATL
ncbi:MAG TPA: glycine cleavage system protein GcvH [Gammaproteobacteria bacterium]|nr:glycine cleavage system protein GcvH [Gammaproteobacteria bacterium]